MINHPRQMGRPVGNLEMLAIGCKETCAQYLPIDADDAWSP